MRSPRSTRSDPAVRRKSFNSSRARVETRRAPSANRHQLRRISSWLLERALSTKVKLKQGEKEQIVTKAAAGIEQLVNQFAKGDRHARRDLIALADKLGVDLLAGQRNIIQEALAPNHQAILDAYVARQSDVEGLLCSRRCLAPPELVDDDAENQNPE